MVSSEKLRRWSSSSIIFRKRVTGGYLLVTRIYLSRQAPTAPFASRVASAASRLRSDGLHGSWQPIRSQLPYCRQSIQDCYSVSKDYRMPGHEENQHWDCIFAGNLCALSLLLPAN